MKTKPMMTLVGLTLLASTSALANADTSNDIKFGISVEGMCGINIVDGKGVLGIGGKEAKNNAEIEVVNNQGLSAVDTQVAYTLAPELESVAGFEESLTMTVGNQSKALMDWESGTTPVESGQVLTVKQVTSFDEMEIPAMETENAITTTFTVLCDAKATS